MQNSEAFSILLVRAALVFAVVVALPLFWVTGALTSVRQEADATYYELSPLQSLGLSGVAIAFLLVGLGLLLQPKLHGRAIGVVVLAAAISVAALMIPTNLQHHVIVSDEGFSSRSGAWFSPVERNVRFEDLRYIQVRQVESTDGDKKARFVLECVGKDEDVTIIPVAYLMQKALPEILRKAGQQKVPIVD